MSKDKGDITDDDPYRELMGKVEDAICGVDDEWIVIEVLVAVLTDTDFVSSKALKQICKEVNRKPNPLLYL